MLVWFGENENNLKVTHFALAGDLIVPQQGDDPIIRLIM